MSQNGCEPNWSWAEMVIYQNDPQPREFGAGSILYKGDMIQMLVSSGILFYCLPNVHDDNNFCMRDLNKP